MDAKSIAYSAHLTRHAASSLAMCFATMLTMGLGIGVLFAAEVVPAEPAGDAAGAAEQAPFWPMRIQTAQGLVTIYAPQITQFNGDKISARAAVSVARAGKEPIFGAIWFDSRVATDRVARTVEILNVTVTRAKFPESDGLTERALTHGISVSVQENPMVISLDHLLAMVEAIKQEQQENIELLNDPPHVVFRRHPSVLIQYDGEPRLIQVASNTLLLRAINTPYFVVLDTPSKTYYLKGGGQWFSAPGPLGPFESAKSVPPMVAVLADASGYKDPQLPISAATVASLEIITATEPTELIWTDGPEEMAPLAGTDLLYVTNTDSDVFLRIPSQEIYILLAGRWYVAGRREGPWTFVPPDKLPADFQRISPLSAKGDVLAHVAGTQAASEAVADTYVPQTAAIDRNIVQPLQVSYDGDPQFEVIERSEVRYAVNTSYAVLLMGGRYYCCHNAVWYVAVNPIGPWEICVSVPAVIYSIPPSCPIYYVRYVYVYDATPDYVYVGYLPGYVGCYSYRGVVVYGTGYRYRPWFRNTVYYARPATFGFSVQYDAYTGYWGFSVGYRSDSASVWIGTVATRPITTGTDWFGHGGYRPTIRHRETHTYRYTGTVVTPGVATPAPKPPPQSHEINIYQRREDIRKQMRPTVRQPTTPVKQPPEIRPVVPHPPVTPRGPVRGDDHESNVFADPNGQVYRKTLDGWEQRKDNRWVPPAATQPKLEVKPPPSESRDSERLNRDYRARVNGEQRSRDIPRAQSKRSSNR